MEAEIQFPTLYQYQFQNLISICLSITIWKSGVRKFRRCIRETTITTILQSLYSLYSYSTLTVTHHSLYSQFIDAYSHRRLTL